MPYFVIALFMLGCIGLMFPQWRAKSRLRRWQRRLDLKAHQAVFDRLYHDVNGFTISRQARANQDAFEYTYGEIEFQSFIALIGLTNPSIHTRFLDLGSGTGKAVIACAMVYPISDSRGIELFKPLHEAACTQKERLAERPEYSQKAKNIHFIHANFLQEPLDDATLIFLNATALFGPTWDEINQQLTQSTTQAIVITTSKPLKSPAYEVTLTTPVQMSWGIVNAYIQHRKMH